MNRTIVAAVLCLAAAPALAQQPEKQLVLQVSVSEAQQILNMVSQAPWKDANPLMQKLIAEVNAQMAPPKPPAPAVEPPAKKTEPKKPSAEKPKPSKKDELPLSGSSEDPDK